MEYDSALKRMKILTYAITWMNSDSIILSEISQSRNTNTVRFHLYEVLRVVKFIKTEIAMVVLGWEE